jgi:hypothetical protein
VSQVYDKSTPLVGLRVAVVVDLFFFSSLLFSNPQRTLTLILILIPAPNTRPKPNTNKKDENNPKHHTLCSPRSHPTAEYIDAHADLFADWHPAPAPALWDIWTLRAQQFATSRTFWTVFLAVTVCTWLCCRVGCSSGTDRAAYQSIPSEIRDPRQQVDVAESGMLPLSNSG